MAEHGILYARYADPEPPGGYAADAAVIAVHERYGEQSRRANDDIHGGGMLAFLADSGTIGPYEAAPVDLASYAADKRYEVETGGFYDGAGRRFATDRDSQGKLVAEMVALQSGLRADPSGWKLMGDGFVLLTNVEMLAVIIAARGHIADAFATEAAVLAGITAGTITTTAQIDAAAWPSNGPPA